VGERANITRRREIDARRHAVVACRRSKRRVKQLRSLKLLVELFGLRGAGESEGVAVRVEGGGHKVEVARTYFALVLDSGVAAFHGRKLRLLQVYVCGHALARVAVGKVEH
jgi:hypothetical protein